MKRVDLIKSVVAKSGISSAEVELVVNAFLESVKESLVEEESVTLVGFGTFLVKETKARNGYSPATGQSLLIPAKKVIRFKPSKKIIINKE